MPALAVAKMHGAYNDFVVLDGRSAPLALEAQTLARVLCDRRAGVGADGLLVIDASTRADARMRIFNADGSEAEMCGNGVRCAARYLSEAGAGDRFVFETIAGAVQTEILDKGRSYRVRAAIGVPQFPPLEIPHADSVFVSLGNPHIVIFTPPDDPIDLEETAQRLQHTPGLHGGSNVHLAARIAESTLRVLHWERGVGATFACGTGAVACAAAAIRARMVRSPVTVQVPGGTLFVEWDGSATAYLTGPAVRVFDTVVMADGDPAHDDRPRILR